MTFEYYERLRTKIFGGHKQNLFMQLLKDRAGISRPIQGTPEEFSQMLYALSRGDLNRRSEHASYLVIPKGKKDVLKFNDGSLFTVVKLRGDAIHSSHIVVAPGTLSSQEDFAAHEMPLARLVQESLKIQDTYTQVSWQYKNEERAREAEKAAEERRIARECTLETTLKTIETSRSGDTILIRGLPNIDGLVKVGFVSSLVDNPENWVDPEDVPGLRYRHAKSGKELLLTARERLQPATDANRVAMHFYVNRSDDDPESFKLREQKFRNTKKDGSAYSVNELRDDLLAMAVYPDELKGRTEQDLTLMADEVELAMDRRQEQDKTILPYEAVANRDTRAVIDAVLKNKTPAAEVRKALDYYEYSGLIDMQYKAILHDEINRATRITEGKGLDSLLQDKRVKEIVATVLKKLSGEQLTVKTITLAMAPYVGELGFGKLVKIRERILQLREMVHHQDLKEAS